MMIRAVIVCAVLAAGAVSTSAEAKVCKAPVEATGHGQNVEPSLPDYGDAYAKKDARKKWRAAVIAADGLAFAKLSKAKSITYTPDAGAGQIYEVLKATPCK